MLEKLIFLYNPQLDEYKEVYVKYDDIGKELYHYEIEGWYIDQDCILSDKLDMYANLSNYKIDLLIDKLNKL